MKALPEHSAAWHQACLPEWETIWPVCARWIRRWPIPPRWSARDWWEEVRAQAQAAAWEALCAYDPERNITRARFVRGRILARVLKCYRREWAYGRRCAGAAPAAGDHRWAHEPKPPAPWPGEAGGLDRLAEADRLLLERLLVDGLTQAELAHELGISQATISRRKRFILNELRREAQPNAKISTLL
jgi:hypothetical protein